jgi:hypothetical protein
VPDQAVHTSLARPLEEDGRRETGGSYPGRLAGPSGRPVREWHAQKGILYVGEDEELGVGDDED